MYTPELILALQCQAVVLVLTVLIGTFVLRVPWTAAMWAGLLFNSLPVTSPPGYESPLFIHDLLLPVLAGLTLVGRAWTRDRLIWLVVATALVWPMTGSLVALSFGEDSNHWIAFGVRRVGFILFFVIGVSGMLRSIRATDFLDCCVLAWVLMLVPALLQYFGIIDTDIHPIEEDHLRGLSIWESAAAQRGFLGLNRGAVGVWGSAIASYCLVNFFLNQRPGRARWVLYNLGAVLSYVVILFSGTRTGLLAAAASALFVGLRVIGVRNQVRPMRVVTFGAVTVLAGVYLLGPVVTRIAERFSVESAALGTGQSRVGVQMETLRYVAGDTRAAVLGMGPSVSQFYDRVGQNTEDFLQHPHSEFVEILWQTGVPGLLLYLVMLGTFYFGIAMPRTSRFYRESLAGQSMLVAGLISGIAVGNIMITTSRLATFGMLMAFVYGRLIWDMRAARSEAAAEFDAPAHEEADEQSAGDELANIIELPEPALARAGNRMENLR